MAPNEVSGLRVAWEHPMPGQAALPARCPAVGRQPEDLISLREKFVEATLAASSDLAMAVVRTAPSLAALRPVPRRVLAVFAHPDDEAYGCAGALARYAANENAATVLLTMTRGEASSMGPQRGLTPTQVGDLREQRLEQVAEILGLDGLIVADLPDGQLAKLEFRDLAAPIQDVLEHFEPEVIITHDARGVNGHPDHIAVHWGVRWTRGGTWGSTCFTRLALVAYPPETCEAAKPRLLFPTANEDIDVSLELSAAEIDAKEACLRVHEGLITVRPVPGDDRPSRPPVEHFDLFDECFAPPLSDLFDHLLVADAPGT